MMAEGCLLDFTAISLIPYDLVPVSSIIIQSTILSAGAGVLQRKTQKSPFSSTKT
jgi:hypothetical protein